MPIDGNMVDMASMAIGGLFAMLRPIRRWHSNSNPCFRRDYFLNDLLNGAMLVPFALMIAAVFSSEFTSMLIASTKLTLAFGGAFGLVHIIGELFKSDP